VRALNPSSPSRQRKLSSPQVRTPNPEPSLSGVSEGLPTPTSSPEGKAKWEVEG
jgi:hypothetical protein